MKILRTLTLFIAAMFFMTAERPLDASTSVSSSNVVSQLEVSEAVLNQSTFYECRNVGDGWRRCSKRNGRCFGATFPTKRVCESVLNGDDD